MKTLEDLIPKLLDKTREGTISWTLGNTPDSFKTTFSKYRIDVWKWQEPQDETEGISVGLRKKDDDKDIIDTIYYDTYSSRYPRFSELHAMARRSALSIDKIIDEISDELDIIF